jgi:hypothetical protein
MALMKALAECYVIYTARAAEKAPLTWLRFSPAARLLGAWMPVSAAQEDAGAAQEPSVFGSLVVPAMLQALEQIPGARKVAAEAIESAQAGRKPRVYDPEAGETG